MSSIPVITICNILQHHGKGHTLKEIRNHKKPEGYILHKDGYVLDVQSCCFDGKRRKFSAVVAKVKPRTNPKDPTTSLPYYITLVILSGQEDSEMVHSACCTCRGG